MDKWVLLVMLMALQVADVTTTNHGLAANAGVSEMNPIMALCMDKFGSLWWFPKLGLIGYAVVASPRLSLRALSFVSLFYAALVTNNLFYF